MIFGREPAAIAAFIAIAINLAITFGLKLTADQIALINSLVVAGLALVVRHASTPTAAPTLKAGTEVSVKGTSDSVVIAPTPPGPVGVEGGAISNEPPTLNTRGDAP